MLKVATNTTRIALENYNNNDQQFNRHDFRWHFLSWPMRLVDRCTIKAILWVSLNLNTLLGNIVILVHIVYCEVVVSLASSGGGPGFNPHSRTASYQRRYKKWYL